MSDGRIHRRRVTEETIPIPEGHRVCPRCNGRGMLSKYDEDWRSVMPSRNLSALRDCFRCQGRGFVPASLSSSE